MQPRRKVGKRRWSGSLDPCSTTPTTPKSPANPSIFHFLPANQKPRQPAKVAAKRWRGATYVSGPSTCSFYSLFLSSSSSFLYYFTYLFPS